MKNALPYYKRYPRDFLEGTVGLDLETKGAYSILLDMIYQMGGRLPDDDKWISGQLGCKVARWKAIKSTLLDGGKICMIDGKIANSRADLELKDLKSYSEKQAERASGSRKNNDIAEATALPKQSQPEPEPDKSKKEPSVPKKGTRIPADFQPDLDAAVNIGLRPERAISEAAKFKDYWEAESGQKASKLDWHKTWLVWARSAFERQGGPRGSPGKSAFQQHQETARQSLEDALKGTEYDQSTRDTEQPAFDLDPSDWRATGKTGAGK